MSQPSPNCRAGLPPSAVVREELVERGAWGAFVPAQPLWLLRKGRRRRALAQRCRWVSGHPERKGEQPESE